jgi:hypothetical protein
MSGVQKKYRVCPSRVTKGLSSPPAVLIGPLKGSGALQPEAITGG